MILIKNGVVDISGNAIEITEDIIAFYASTAKNNQLMNMNKAAMEIFNKRMQEDPDLMDHVYTIHEGPIGRD